MSTLIAKNPCLQSAPVPDSFNLPPVAEDPQTPLPYPRLVLFFSPDTIDLPRVALTGSWSPVLTLLQEQILQQCLQSIPFGIKFKYTCC